VQREVNTISKQIEAQNKAIAAEEKATQDKKIADEKVRTDAISKIQDEFVQKQKDKDVETELEKINLEEERKLAELERLEASELQKQEVRDYYSGLRVENQIELDAKEKAGTEQAAAEDIALNKKVKDAKVGIAQQTLGLIGAIAGKGSKIAKGVAIAQATISGIQATQNAYTTAALSPITTVFPAYPFVQAGLAAGFAALNIASIKSTSSSGGGGVSAPSGGAGAVASAAPKPPSFNIVGASDTNQLADAVAGQENQPVQAYVVANDVTSAQSLQNNIVEGSTID
jgi:actin-related protein